MDYVPNFLFWWALFDLLYHIFLRCIIKESPLLCSQSHPWRKVLPITKLAGFSFGPLFTNGTVIWKEVWLLFAFTVKFILNHTFKLKITLTKLSQIILIHDIFFFLHVLGCFPRHNKNNNYSTKLWIL